MRKPARQSPTLPNVATFSAPAVSPTTGNCPQEDDQDHRPDEGDDDAPKDANRAARHQEPEQEPANEGPDDADDDVADQPETTALHELSGRPAGDESDHEPDEQS